MNTAPLKTYAPEARRAFIAAVSAQAARLGITATGTQPAEVQGDVLLVGGQAFPRTIASARNKLVERVQAHGFAPAMEAIAYTWFNRFVAIRYMELHDYLAEHPKEREIVLANLTYFDQLNLADAITCPTLIASSLTDDVHPLNTVMPVFEKIQAMKSIVVYPDLDHEYQTDFTQHGKAWMDRYLG